MTSQVVISEASSGDKAAAAARLALLAEFRHLTLTDAVKELAAKLVERSAVPPEALEDALHIAAAAAHGIDYLLTWNFKHMANATVRRSIERVCRDAGFEPAIICTPEELMDDTHT